MVGKGKKKRARDEDEEEEVVLVDKTTSLYVKCRDFIGLSRDQLKEFVEKQGFEVKAVNKPNKKEFGFVDVGSSEKLDELCEKLKGMKYKGSIIIADRVKDNKDVLKNKEAKPAETIAILDRLLCVRGLTKFVSKRTLMDVFKKVESVIIPSSKGNLLRDALIVFHNPDQVTRAIKEFQGWELGGEKLKLERLVSISCVDSDLTINEINRNNTNNNIYDDDDDVTDKNSKKHKRPISSDVGGEEEDEDGSDDDDAGKLNKSLKNAKQKNKQKKKPKSEEKEGDKKDTKNIKGNKSKNIKNDGGEVSSSKVEPPKKKAKK